MRAELITEILRETHRYAPGLEQYRPSLGRDPSRRVGPRDRVRDMVERTAGRAGFTRRHFDPAAGALRLEEVIAMSEGLERTYARLGDERSRRALLDILKWRVLGPYHAPLRISPEAFRAQQSRVERELVQEHATYEVSDPFFSPISRYRILLAGGSEIELHCHSVDIVSVFVLEQYSYRTVKAQSGDVVLDVGGCWGDTALYFADLVGPRGKVFTFEFDPENLAIMRANFALNPGLAKRIEVVELALWDRSNVSLAFTESGRCTGVTDDGGGDRAVSTITLDDFVVERGLERVDLVKMDIEGSEQRALAGAQRSLARFAPRLAVAAYHTREDLVRLPELMPACALFLDTFSPLEEETVLFAAPLPSVAST